jgi:ADP-ribose pyrophosphatase YjhB (NUDIX family)
MNFCSNCGVPISLRVPPGDNLPRHVCDACGSIFYQNPRMIVGCIAEWGDRILLCRRAIEPRYGLWTLPAGFMENGETVAQAAARETLEEACARVEIGAMYSFINVPHISQVHIMFRAKLLESQYAAGAESLEVKLFQEEEIPWNELAFATIRETLTRYYADRKAGSYGFHLTEIRGAGR